MKKSAIEKERAAGGERARLPRIFPFVFVRFSGLYSISKSSETSRAGAEWVTAPMLIRAAPASA